VRPLPNVDDVLAQASGAQVSPAEIERLLARSLTLMYAHTRGGGFAADRSKVDGVLARISVASVVRVILNPECALTTANAPFTASPGSFGEWTLDELRTLAAYEEHTQSID
jgi:hypothetical protein